MLYVTETPCVLEFETATTYNHTTNHHFFTYLQNCKVWIAIREQIPQKMGSGQISHQKVTKNKNKKTPTN